MASSAVGAAVAAVAVLLLLAPGAEPIGLWLPPPTGGGGRLGGAAAPGRYLTQEERWMDQTLDHFNPTDHRQFKQRYYEFLDYYRAPKGPIFLYICGESSCNGIPNSYLAVMAKKFGAAVVSPEHRYYGKSSPFESLTTENLRFLSSKQALFDLAVFRQYYQETLNAKYNRSGADSSWFVFGGSYAGALSAWFRLKFPHLTWVVLAVYNFTDFDKQVGDSAGPECKAALQEVTRLVDEQLRLDSRSVKVLFGAEKLKNDGDFLFFLADAAAIGFQYGSPDAVCSPLINAKKTGRSLVETYAQYVQDFFIRRWGTTVSSYDQEYLKNTTPDDTNFGGSKFAVRLPIFKWHPKTIAFALQRSIQASKIVFTNGSQDPWRHASKQKSSKYSDPSNCSSPAAVSTVRKQIASHISLWLSQCQEPTRAW
uniref:Serine carboxypeptidase S28 family protein n=1 Tax=Oryza rufipogon TaxID=4529 RepID=A0A0E0R1B0_ORYRU